MRPGVGYTTTAIAATTIGYYAYLPEDHFYQAEEEFPLLIFPARLGRKGQRHHRTNKILIHGPPKLVKNGRLSLHRYLAPAPPPRRAAGRWAWSMN